MELGLNHKDQVGISWQRNEEEMWGHCGDEQRAWNQGLRVPYGRMKGHLEALAADGGWGRKEIGVTGEGDDG